MTIIRSLPRRALAAAVALGLAAVLALGATPAETDNEQAGGTWSSIMGDGGGSTNGGTWS